MSLNVFVIFQFVVLMILVIIYKVLAKPEPNDLLGSEEPITEVDSTVQPDSNASLIKGSMDREDSADGVDALS